jgi:hypothetical protein
MEEGSGLLVLLQSLFRDNISWPQFNKEVVKATLGIVLVNGGLALAYKGNQMLKSP